MIIKLNKYHKKRLIYIVAIACGIAIAASLILSALKQNINVFLTPTEAARVKNSNYTFRLGGMVKEHSVKKSTNELAIKFVVTDFTTDVPVIYRGILPDLFREGKGVIAEGKLNRDGSFTANFVLAKHDENYMPNSVYKKIKEKK